MAKFEGQLKVRERSKHTIKAYLGDLTLLAAKLGEKSFIQANSADLRAFFFELRGLRDAVSTKRAYSAVRTFYRWLAQEGYLDSSPALDLVSPKAAQKEPLFLSEVEVMDLLARTGVEEPHFVRDQAVLELLYSSGLRVSELAHLDVRDLDFNRRLVLAREGKGAKDRLVPLGRPAIKAIKEWLSQRESVPHKDPQALFLGAKGARLQDREVRRLLKRRLALAGLDLRFHPHSLRHSFASHLLAAGAGLKPISEMLGHKSLAATQRYAHLDLTALRKAYAAHPRAKT
jgi:integrase/recombinase XerC